MHVGACSYGSSLGYPARYLNYVQGLWVTGNMGQLLIHARSVTECKCLTA